MVLLCGENADQDRSRRRHTQVGKCPQLQGKQLNKALQPPIEPQWLDASKQAPSLGCLDVMITVVAVMAGNHDTLTIYSLIFYHRHASSRPCCKNIETGRTSGMVLLTIPHRSITSPTHRQRYTSFGTVGSGAAEGRYHVAATTTAN